MSERSLWDDLKPTWRDAVVLTIGFVGGVIIPSKIKQYIDKRDAEQAERIASYIKENQKDASFHHDLSQLYKGIENLTRKIEGIESKVYQWETKT